MAELYQQDFKINVSNDPIPKATLALSPTGDIQLVQGRDKLAEQILRAILNDQTISVIGLNSPAVTNRGVNALFTLILRDFKQVQIAETKRIDDNLSGFCVFRRKVGRNTDFVKLTADAINWKYIDTEVENGIAYEYGVTKVYRNIYESLFVDNMTITPTRFTHKQDILIGSNIVAIPGDQQVTFYLDSHRYFLASELFNTIVSIEVQQSTTDPRHYKVEVVVEDLKDNKLSVASSSFKLI